MKDGEWLREYVREFADRLEHSVMERERERAAMIVENAYVYSPYIVRKLGIAERKAEIAAKIRGDNANA